MDGIFDNKEGGEEGKTENGQSRNKQSGRLGDISYKQGWGFGEWLGVQLEEKNKMKLQDQQSATSWRGREEGSKYHVVYKMRKSVSIAFLI